MTFATEAELCLKFSEWANRKKGLLVCNEHEGWDQILVRESDGFQYGVQAKRWANVDVLFQAWAGMRRDKTPDMAVCLVPKASFEFRGLCHALGIAVAAPVNEDADGFVTFEVVEPEKRPERSAQRCRVPRYRNENPAGVPSPRTFTEWTAKELRLESIMHRNGGYVKAKDLKRVGLSPMRLPNWLYHSGYNRWSQVEGSELPSKHHPKNYATIEKEMQPVRT